jgi:1,2-diacylglycerol 3-alpha-glucosyltransferase
MHTEQRMKICLASERAATISGVGTHLQSLASALKKRGHDVFIITNDQINENPSGVRLYNHRYVQLDRISNKLMFLKELLAFFTYSFRVFSKERPDVVHTHCFYDFYIAKLIGIILRFPVVNTHHSYVFSCPLSNRVRDGQFCTNLNEDNCRAEVGFIQNLKKKITRRIHLYFADAIVTLNRIEYDYFKRLTSKVHFISNWIDTSLFSVPDTRKKGKTIVFVGGFRPVKRLDILLNAFTTLVKKDPEFHLLVIGELKPNLLALYQVNLEEYIGGIKDTIEKNRLSDHITFSGIVPASKMPAMYASGDIYVSCSFTEVNPVAFLEAIACNLPIVAFTNPMCLDITVSNPERLADDIKVTLHKGLDEHVFNQVREYYSENAIISRFEALYRTLVKKRTRGIA